MAFPICIFEDHQYSNLYPLSLTRPVFDLQCGILTLREKIERQFPDNSKTLFCRNFLKNVLQQENPGIPVNKADSNACLFINGRVIADDALIKSLDTSEELIFTSGKMIIAAFLKGTNIAQFVTFLEREPNLDIKVKQMSLDDIKLIEYPWNLVHQNAAEIVRDFSQMNKGNVLRGEIAEGAVLVNQGSIHLGTNSVVKPGAILDAESGPIYIGDEATVMHNAVIKGPAFVGNHSTIKISAKIYEGTSIGEVCKVGGEVEESTIHSYSNKQHDGFLGHAYLGQWVNLGADTNNSDLKNNYGNVNVPINGEMVDSGSKFVGLFMGDHSKTGINTMFNTGTVVGTMCNVFGAGFPPKYVPSFSWGGAEGLVEHQLDKAIDTARQVMARRKKELTPEYEEVIRDVFEFTQNERADFQSQ